MELPAAIQASLAGRYAVALFEVASESGVIGTIEADLEMLEKALAESADLRSLIANPKVSRGQLGAVMEALCTRLGLSPLAVRFVGVLAGNRRLPALPSIIRAFAAIAAAHRGEVQAEVASAHALNEAQIAQLETRLRAREGRSVKLATRIDPALLGGLVVTIGSRRIDSSIRTRLNSLAKAMKCA